MSESIGSGLSSIIARLREIEQETETIYLRLGDIFPSLMREMDSSARLSSASIDDVLSTRGREDARFNDFLEESQKYFGNVASRERRFLENVEQGIERLARLEGLISAVRLDSEEMEIVSLNAMTVALKSGAAGRAFSVITDELKRLSARTIALTDELSVSGSEILALFTKLRGILRNLNEKQERFFASVRETLEHDFRKLDSDMRETAETCKTFATEAQRVRGPITGIMQVVQVQDIIRQSLDHVIVSLRAAGEGEDRDTDDLAFLSEVSRLSSALLDDVRGKVDRSLRDFRRNMDGIRAIVASVEDRRTNWLAERISEETQIRSGFGEADFMAIKAEAGAVSAKLAESVKRMNERFGVLVTILSRFQNIVVASRIETARNRALSIVANTVTGMIELTERLSSDVGGCMDITKSFIKNVASQLDGYKSSAGGDDTGLMEATLRIGEEYAALGAERSRLQQSVERFRVYSGGFLDNMEAARVETGHIEGISAEFGEMRAELAKVAETVHERVRLAGGSDDDANDIASGRLRELVERFTIFTHKQEAGRIGGFDVGKDVTLAAETGDVTIF